MGQITQSTAVLLVVAECAGHHKHFPTMQYITWSLKRQSFMWPGCTKRGEIWMTFRDHFLRFTGDKCAGLTKPLWIFLQLSRPVVNFARRGKIVKRWRRWMSAITPPRRLCLYRSEVKYEISLDLGVAVGAFFNKIVTYKIAIPQLQWLNSLLNYAWFYDKSLSLCGTWQIF